MNLSLFLTFSPIEMVLSKWTALLAVSWILHSVLRNSHPRWRLILWCTTLCLGILLPLAHLTPAPLLQVPVPSPTNPVQKIAAGNLIGALGLTAAPGQAASQSQHELTANASASHRSNSIEKRKATPAFEWRTIAFMLWSTGILIGAFRLIWLYVCLSQIRSNTVAVNNELSDLASVIQARLGIRRKVQIRVSDSVSSPFVCGLWNPAVILPRALVQNFQANTLSALLGHELAHLRGHDLLVRQLEMDGRRFLVSSARLENSKCTQFGLRTGGRSPRVRTAEEPRFISATPGSACFACLEAASG